MAKAGELVYRTERWSTQSGTYALVLASQENGVVGIGRLGTLAMQPGYYVYVGSAFGPGGLAARVRHHCQIAAHPHWHIDYLRAACDWMDVWFTSNTACCEHAWANALARLPGARVPMEGFGSSDCECETHLYWFQHTPSVRKFRQRVKTHVLTRRTTVLNARP